MSYCGKDELIESQTSRLELVEKDLRRKLTFEEKYELSLLYIVGDVIYDLNPEFLINNKNARKLMMVQKYFLDKKILKEEKRK